MRSVQYRNSHHPFCTVSEPWLGESQGSIVVALHDSLNELADIVSGPSFAKPDSLNSDIITRYALALMRLREYASAAMFERLTKACDALGLTVSRLIDDPSCAAHEKLAALKRFVVHAREMVKLAADSVEHHVLPSRNVHTGSVEQSPSMRRASGS